MENNADEDLGQEEEVDEGLRNEHDVSYTPAMI